MVTTELRTKHIQTIFSCAEIYDPSGNTLLYVIFPDFVSPLASMSICSHRSRRRHQIWCIGFSSFKRLIKDAAWYDCIFHLHTMMAELQDDYTVEFLFLSHCAFHLAL